MIYIRFKAFHKICKNLPVYINLDFEFLSIHLYSFNKICNFVILSYSFLSISISNVRKQCIIIVYLVYFILLLSVVNYRQGVQKWDKGGRYAIIMYLFGLVVILVHYMNSSYGKWTWTLSDVWDELQPSFCKQRCVFKVA